MVNDPIADFLARLRNAIARKTEKIVSPSSKMIESIAKILKDEGFIIDYKIIDQKPQNNIEISLKYVNGMPAIQSLKRISKPGVRNYLGYRDIPRVKNGLGISILSTPRGVMTGKNAKGEKVGGEYLCEIW